MGFQTWIRLFRLVNASQRVQVLLGFLELSIDEESNPSSDLHLFENFDYFLDDLAVFRWVRAFLERICHL